MEETVVELPEELIIELKTSMNHGEIREFYQDGSESVLVKKAEVDRFKGLKIEIFSNEHPPPHFRVKFQDSVANFKIANCTFLNGQGEVVKYSKNIFKWWKNNKQILIEFWNKTRPSDCPVGIYREVQ